MEKVFFYLMLIVFIINSLLSIKILKTFFNPVFLLNVIFIASLSASLSISAEFQFSSETILLYTISILVFDISCFFIVLTYRQKFKKHKSKYIFKVDKVTLKKLFLISIFFEILLLLFQFQMVSDITKGNLSLIVESGSIIRNKIVHYEGNYNSLEKILRYLMNIGKMSVPISAMLFFYQDKKYLIFTLAITFMISFISLERSYFFKSFLFAISVIVSCYIYYKKRFEIKYLLRIALAGLIVYSLLLIPYSLRNSDYTISDINNSMQEYIGSSNLALNNVINSKEEFNTLAYGSYMFNGVSNILAKYGIVEETVDYHLQFNELELKSGIKHYNVYTYLYYILKDFGYVGIIVMNILLGILYTCIYLKLFVQRNFKYLILYSFLIQNLMWFFYSFDLKSIGAYITIALSYFFATFIYKKSIPRYKKCWREYRAIKNYLN